MSLFVCAGMIRSGSTWLYNAARLLLLDSHPDLQSSWIEDRNEPGVGPELVKVHNADQALAARASIILTCHRDLRDVALSIRSVGWIDDLEQILPELGKSRTHYDFWHTRSALDLPYEAIINDDQGCLRRIATALSLEADEDAISRIALLLRTVPNNRTPDQAYDAEFLTHANHRTDGRAGRWREQLPPGLAQRIYLEHREWMEQRGYRET